LKLGTLLSFFCVVLEGEGNRAGRGRIRKVIEGVNIIILYYMHIWKFHDEIPYFRQFNIHQL
jgi:hypothetical protein